MKVFEYDPQGSPRQWGRAHGEAFAPMIRDLASIRLELCTRIGGFSSEQEVLELAAQHGPVVEKFDHDLYEELVGISEGANVDLSRVVVLNHYTDIRDIRPSDPGGSEECSAVYARTGDVPLLGQTWDMHGSAEPYVVMLRVPARENTPASWVFSITGCVGMTGLNSKGVGITINNLKSQDAKVGIIWPALVRHALKAASAGAARDRVLSAPLGSGHHYLIASAKAAVGIETSGTVRKVMFEGEEASYVHTNHCLDPDAAAKSTVAPTSTTHVRYDALTRGIEAAAVQSRQDLWNRLGSHDGYPRSVCTHVAGPHEPHAMRTCGGLIMDLQNCDLWAVQGCLNHAQPHRFGF